MKQPAVYILASQRNGTLYVGVTSRLVQRIWEHRNHVFEGFTSQYSVTQLVYYEFRESMVEALRREKQLKNWKRAWKIRLIEKNNPQWLDLWCQLLGRESNQAFWKALESMPDVGEDEDFARPLDMGRSLSFLEDFA